MHRIITILATLPDLTICPAGKRDGKRGSHSVLIYFINIPKALTGIKLRNNIDSCCSF